jgi:ankyrin repeat protein
MKIISIILSSFIAVAVLANPSFPGLDTSLFDILHKDSKFLTPQDVIEAEKLLLAGANSRASFGPLLLLYRPENEVDNEGVRLRLELIKLLLKFKADPYQKGSLGQTALHVQSGFFYPLDIDQQKIQIAKIELLDSVDFNADAFNDSRYGSILEKAILYRSFRIATHLVRNKRVNADFSSRLKMTPLMHLCDASHAANEENLALLDSLIDAQADINATDSFGKNIMDHCFFSGSYEDDVNAVLLPRLIDLGAKFGDQYSPLIRTLEAALPTCGNPRRNYCSMSPETVKLLSHLFRRNDLDLNFQDTNGSTFLIKAVKFLESYGDPLVIQNSTWDGDWRNYQANVLPVKEFVLEAIKKGARRELKDKSNRSAYDYSSRKVWGKDRHYLKP